MMRFAVAIVALVICPCFVRTTPAQEAGVKQPSFDSGGVPIHYKVMGQEDGEPVVLIHGFAGSIDRQWAPVIGALKKDFKIIAFDCRGHGGSGKPHDPKKYGVEMVNDVARLMDHLKVDKAHIVGYSMGSNIALGFAVRYPERVRSVVLGGSSGLMRGQEEMIAAVADSLENGNGLTPLILALTPKDLPKPSPEAIKIIDGLVSSVNDIKALAAIARSASNDQLSDEQVAGVKAPMVVIIGADDPLRTGIDHLEKLLPKTEVVIIDKADHMTAFRRTEFSAAVKKFLEEHRQGAGR